MKGGQLGTEGLGNEVPSGVQGRAPVAVWGFGPEQRLNVRRQIGGD